MRDGWRSRADRDAETDRNSTNTRFSSRSIASNNRGLSKTIKYLSKKQDCMACDHFLLLIVKGLFTCLRKSQLTLLRLPLPIPTLDISSGSGFPFPKIYHV